MTDAPDFEAMAREVFEGCKHAGLYDTAIDDLASTLRDVDAKAFERGRASRDASSETFVHFSDAQVRREITRLMREDFDPHPSWELPAGQWDDNADDVATKIVALFRSQIATLTQERDERHEALMLVVNDVGIEHARIVTLEREAATLRAQLETVKAALSALVHRIDEISHDASFKGVWTIYHVHGGVYTGPNWAEPLEKARSAIIALEVKAAP